MLKRTTICKQREFDENNQEVAKVIENLESISSKFLLNLSHLKIISVILQ